MEEFNPHTLLKNTMMAMDSSIYNKNLKMNYQISDNVPDILKGDPSRIRQVLINLISNAIKFTENGNITVRCSKISDTDDSCKIEFSVEDTGVGIPEDKAEIIFERFMQLEGQIKNQYTGTGLGLAISKELIELMGGSIKLESRPGIGSTFTFQISLRKITADEHINKLNDKTTGENILKPLNVLIAEDVFTNWMLYERYMQILGHSFKIVENGNMVLDELEHNDYNIVLMDIEMPGMNGEETLHLIRKGNRRINNNIPVIAMTGYSKNDLKKTDYEFTGFLIKPVELEDLDRLINQIMNNKENLDEPGLLY